MPSTSNETGFSRYTKTTREDKISNMKIREAIEAERDSETAHCFKNFDACQSQPSSAMLISSGGVASRSIGNASLTANYLAPHVI